MSWEYIIQVPEGRHHNHHIEYNVSVLGRDEGYTVKYTPLPEGVPEGEARGSSWRQRGIFDRISQVES